MTIYNLMLSLKLQAMAECSWLGVFLLTVTSPFWKSHMPLWYKSVCFLYTAALQTCCCPQLGCLNKFWKEIQRQSPTLTTRACQHMSSRFQWLALITTAMFLLWWPLTTAWIPSEMYPGKEARTVDFTPVLALQISLMVPLGKELLPFSRTAYTQKQQLSLVHGKSKPVLLNTKAHHKAPTALEPVPHLLWLLSALPLTTSTQPPLLPSWATFLFLIKFRVPMFTKNSSVDIHVNKCLLNNCYVLSNLYGGG